MKYIKLLLLLFILQSCNVDKRIKDYSYTDEWYYIDEMRFQVYKTQTGKKYIIILNERETRFKRKYIK